MIPLPILACWIGATKRQMWVMTSLAARMAPQRALSLTIFFCRLLSSLLFVRALSCLRLRSPPTDPLWLILLVGWSRTAGRDCDFLATFLSRDVRLRLMLPLGMRLTSLALVPSLRLGAPWRPTRLGSNLLRMIWRSPVGARANMLPPVIWGGGGSRSSVPVRLFVLLAVPCVGMLMPGVWNGPVPVLLSSPFIGMRAFVRARNRASGPMLVADLLSWNLLLLGSLQLSPHVLRFIRS